MTVDEELADEPRTNIRLPLYIPLEAAEQAQQRQRSAALMRETVRFARPPRELVVRLAAHPLVLNRHVATPNQETVRFLDMAKEAKRPALILEMPADGFTPSLNRTKRNLARLPIMLRIDRPGHRRVRVVDFGAMEGKPLAEVDCLDGRPLLQLHHELFERAFGPGAACAAIDLSNFYRGCPPQLAYERLFALFTCCGVLADNYPLSGFEASFTERVVLPAFESTVQRFGASPIIVRLLPVESEADESWEWYPPEILGEARVAAAYREAR